MSRKPITLVGAIGVAALLLGVPADAGTPDNGTPDNGTPDNGTPDNGTPDNGTPDNGTPDNGTPNSAARLQTFENSYLFGNFFAHFAWVSLPLTAAALTNDGSLETDPLLKEEYEALYRFWQDPYSVLVMSYIWANAHRFGDDLIYCAAERWLGPGHACTNPANKTYIFYGNLGLCDYSLANPSRGDTPPRPSGHQGWAVDQSLTTDIACQRWESALLLSENNNHIPPVHNLYSARGPSSDPSSPGFIGNQLTAMNGAVRAYKYHFGTDTPVRSISDACPDGTIGTAKCGWTAAFDGVCSPFDVFSVTMHNPYPVDMIAMLNQGIHANDYGNPSDGNFLGASVSPGVREPVVTGTCPSSGRFNIQWTAYNRDELGAVGPNTSFTASLVAGYSASPFVKYPASELDIFSTREGHFHGNIFLDNINPALYQCVVQVSRDAQGNPYPPAQACPGDTNVYDHDEVALCQPSRQDCCVPCQRGTQGTAVYSQGYVSLGSEVAFGTTYDFFSFYQMWTNDAGSLWSSVTLPGTDFIINAGGVAGNILVESRAVIVGVIPNAGNTRLIPNPSDVRAVGTVHAGSGSFNFTSFPQGLAKATMLAGETLAFGFITPGISGTEAVLIGCGFPQCGPGHSQPGDASGLYHPLNGDPPYWTGLWVPAPGGGPLVEAIGSQPAHSVGNVPLAVPGAGAILFPNAHGWFAGLFATNDYRSLRSCAEDHSRCLFNYEGPMDSGAACTNLSVSIDTAATLGYPPPARPLNDVKGCYYNNNGFGTPTLAQFTDDGLTHYEAYGVTSFFANHASGVDGVQVSCSSGNQAPIASAVPSATVVCAGDTVTLDGSGTSDPDGDPLSYVWLETNRAIPPLSGVNTFFTTPAGLGGTTLTVNLTASDPCNLIGTSPVNITVKHDNRAPVAMIRGFCGGGQTVSAFSAVTLDGSASFDPDGDALSYSWEQTAGPPVTLVNATTATPSFEAPGVSGATLTFKLSVTDSPSTSSVCGGALSSAPEYVNVFVEGADHPPVADAGPDQTRDEGTIVTLDGSSSCDPDHDTLTYAWTQIGGTPVMLSDATARNPTFTAPSQPPDGSEALIFQLVVTAAHGVASTPDTVQITVQDANSPPDCSLAAASVASLWPPDHKMRSVSIVGVKDTDNSNVFIHVDSVFQDEPTNGLGSGDTPIDANIINIDGSVLLRAERSGQGNGRVYHINFTASDGVGGTCSGHATVCVPRNQGSGAKCVDEGQLYDSTH